MGGKFENVIIFSDLDGTYFARNEEGDKRNREKIEYFKANGGHFTFATGRPLASMLHDIPDAEEIVNLPISCCNGAYLYDLKSDKVVAENCIDRELVYDIQKKFLEIEETYEDCSDTAEIRFIFVDSENGDREGYRSIKLKRDIYDFLSEEEWQSRRIYKAVFVGKADKIQNVSAHLTPYAEDRAFISFATSTYYEFNAYGVSKATAIKDTLAKCFEGRKMMVCAAGDYGNDVEMLKVADLACCPENAHPDVKAVCHKEFCHHSKGLIADIIEYLDTIM